MSNATLINPLGGRHRVTLRGFGSPPSESERVIMFCGHCAHFEVWALGGGGDCHKGHDTHERTAAGICPDKRTHPTSGGPLFDLSE